jgi:ankyrin repeat protein
VPGTVSTKWLGASHVGAGDSLINRRALQDESESTSLHLAADGNHCDVLELLLKNGAQMELKVFLN